MNLSAVVITHNSSAVVEACCASLRHLLPNAEVLVVDNASSDGTPEVCRQLEGVRLLVNDENSGFGRACNLGVGNIRGSHVLILNPDVQVSHVDAYELQEELDRKPFGLLAPTLEHRTTGDLLPAHWSSDLLSHVMGPLRPRELPVFPRVLGRRGTWWPGGALVLVDRDEFTQLGGFDRRFFLYHEDRDLARRYRAAGFPVRATGALRAIHGGSASSTGELAAMAARQGWWYLSWIQYLWIWNGPGTARRAARSARYLRATIDNALDVLGRLGPFSDRVGRKRRELAALESFIRWQCSFGPETAEWSFCPNAREITRGL